MTLAKLAVNALPAGAWGAAVVVLLILAANPAQDEGTAARSVAALAVLPAYALAAAVLWPLLYGALRYFARHPLRLPWFSVRYAMAFVSAHGLIVLGSFWATLSHHRRALHPATVDRLEASGAVLTAAWLIAITVSLLPRLRRIGWLQWGCAVLAGAALVIALPAAWKPAPPDGAGQAPGRTVAAGPARVGAPAQRVVLLNFDGADIETILTLQAQGRLPAFARLIQEGSHGRLRSLQPCVAPVLRATLLTGKLPYRHGVRGAAVRRLLRGDPWIAVVPVGLQFDRLLAPVLGTRPQNVADRRALAVHE
ncbi:MAG: alkaline phosphatase family protein, partial [Candidatus Polarisedimenticolia bacterium]